MMNSLLSGLFWSMPHSNVIFCVSNSPAWIEGSTQLRVNLTAIFVNEILHIAIQEHSFSVNGKECFTIGFTFAHGFQNKFLYLIGFLLVLLPR